MVTGHSNVGKSLFLKVRKEAMEGYFANMTVSRSVFAQEHQTQAKVLFIDEFTRLFQRNSYNFGQFLEQVDDPGHAIIRTTQGISNLQEDMRTLAAFEEASGLLTAVAKQTKDEQDRIQIQKSISNRSCVLKLKGEPLQSIQSPYDLHDYLSFLALYDFDGTLRDTKRKFFTDLEVAICFDEELFPCIHLLDIANII
jgi:hypothetical protein